MKQVTGLSALQIRALRIIRNCIVHDGRSPSVRDLANAMGYKSPRSAAVLLEQLQHAGYVARRQSGELQILRSLPETRDHSRTVPVPVLGRAPCGLPFLANENVEMALNVSDRLARPPHRYFILRAVGDSMNEVGISDGAFVLVRQQPRPANGDIVVALIDDEATIKEFWRTKDVVTLRPRSTNSKHLPIVLTRDFQVQGVVVSTIPTLK